MVWLAMSLYVLKVFCRQIFFSLIGCGHRLCKISLSGNGCARFYGTGVIGSFCEPYVVERLVDRGSYATCMYALGGFLLVQSAMIFGCTGGLV